MKKIIILVSILMGIIINNEYKQNQIIIPDESIRLRVIANSNSIEDQNIKEKIKINLEQLINEKLLNLDSLNNSKEIILENINNFEQIIKQTLKENQNSTSYKINYGNNYFPKKEYQGVTYKEGYYESLVITLGSGKGDNWWCVLFPPLCLLEATEGTEVEYKFLVKELLDKIFK